LVDWAALKLSAAYLPTPTPTPPLQSLQSIVEGVQHGAEPLRVDAVALTVLSAAVTSKAALLVYCWRLKQYSPSVEALVQVRGAGVSAELFAVLL
jgi:hypothetical protein